MAAQSQISTTNNGGASSERQVARKAARWQPGSLFEEMQSDLLRLFEGLPLRRPSFAAAMAMPRIDVFEKEGNLTVKAELPGVKKEDIDLEVEAGELVLHAERKEEHEIKEENWYRMERSTGELYRRIPLPEGVQTNKI